MSKAAILTAGLVVPEFLFVDGEELNALLNLLRDPLVTHVHMLLLVNSNFATGEFHGGYKRLRELCTPPQPERGKRRPGPSLQQLRRVVQDLISQALAMRDAAANERLGQLRLYLKPREQKGASVELHNRKYNRDAKGRKPVSMRFPKGSAGKTEQDISQVYQEGINTPISPQNPSYPQAAPPQEKKPAPEENRAQLARLKSERANKAIGQINQIAQAKTINSPPQGGRKSPHSAGQVAATRLMP